MEYLDFQSWIEYSIKIFFFQDPPRDFKIPPGLSKSPPGFQNTPLDFQESKKFEIAYIMRKITTSIWISKSLLDFQNPLWVFWIPPWISKSRGYLCWKSPWILKNTTLDFQKYPLDFQNSTKSRGILRNSTFLLKNSIFSAWKVS